MRVDVRLLALTLLVLGTPVAAHTEGGAAAGFLSGALHPLTGLDHTLAMVAVGIWGTQIGQPAVWLLPVAFPLVMAVGGALGVQGVPLPAVEIGVAGSAVALGALIALVARPPLVVALAVVIIFAICHGYAHGRELPHSADPLAYSVGFVLITGLLHAVGIGFGLIDRWASGRQLLRGMGGAIAAVGAYLLVGLLR